MILRPWFGAQPADSTFKFSIRAQDTSHMVTVGQLKAALEGAADDIEVKVCLTRPDMVLPIQEVTESHESEGPLAVLLHCDGDPQKIGAA